MNFIPLAKPDITETDIENVATVLRSGMLVQGKNVLALENAFAQFHQSSHAIALANGTATLHLALVAAGIGPGDEVIVPAFSYVATANVVELTGATCVFVDIDIATFNIDVAKIEERITSRTRAIIPVHEFGLACDIEAVITIAEKHDFLVIEDAACALGATQYKKPVGVWGQFGSFSLHPRKSITSGEGGILLLKDEKYAAKIKALRNHGIDPGKIEMDFVEAGFNYRMTDFQAALALGQFERLQQALQYKNELANIYFSEIRHSGMQLPFIPEGHNHTWQTFHLLLGDKLDQKKIIGRLKEKNIGANYGAQCIPAQTYYFKKYSFESASEFPNAWKAYTKGLAIPLYQRMTKEEVFYIAKTINEL
jgi:perosamine synthetase